MGPMGQIRRLGPMGPIGPICPIGPIRCLKASGQVVADARKAMTSYPLPQGIR
jgi:hypothetical protein